MPEFKFGDLVEDHRIGGVYMVVAPYKGKRGANDEKGPAMWIADINTEYTGTGDEGVVWTLEKDLVLFDG